MEFIDLNDEIGADDWLVPLGEITRKRLIKQTPRYKIYKADWFGDVLLYEPKQTLLSENISSRRKRQNMGEPINLDPNELQSRFQELNLRIEKSSESQVELYRPLDNTTKGPRSPTASVCSETGSLESGYSSTSSTPQYHTKQNLKSEFEFPSTWTSMNSLVFDESIVGTTNCDSPLKVDEHHVEEPGNGPSKCSTRTTFPVVLNKDSFRFGANYSAGAVEPNCQACSERVSFSSDPREPESETSWFELNELRLIAHENFMLFMGACVDSATLEANTSEQSTALVMQMSHPKATSLFNLLHASNSATLSPYERIFGVADTKTKALSLETKLNICQQVTNAMTYLHGKNIVHGKLTSVNIYVEPNQQIKISLIDNDEHELVLAEHSDNFNSLDSTKHHHDAPFNLLALTYMSPEMVRSIELGVSGASELRVQIDLGTLSLKSDVFSFGTLLFELFEERFPFAAQNNDSKKFLFAQSLLSPAHNQQLSPLVTINKHKSNITASASELIFQIGSGQINRQNEFRPRCPPIVDQMIADCWASEPWRRPNFKQLSFEQSCRPIEHIGDA